VGVALAAWGHGEGGVGVTSKSGLMTGANGPRAAFQQRPASPYSRDPGPETVSCSGTVARGTLGTSLIVPTGSLFTLYLALPCPVAKGG
jgi:hypothetical protein